MMKMDKNTISFLDILTNLDGYSSILEKYCSFYRSEAGQRSERGVVVAALQEVLEDFKQVRDRLDVAIELLDNHGIHYDLD